MTFVTEEEVTEIRKELVGIQCKGVCHGAGAILGANGFEMCSCASEALWRVRMLDAGIPKKYWNFEFEDLLDKFKAANETELALLQRYCLKIEEVVSKGHGLFISGGPGLAKSSLAYYILKVAILKGIKCHAIRMSQLTKLIFDAITDVNARDKLVWLRDEVQLLMIDEVEKDYKIDNVGTFSGSLVNDFFSQVYDKQHALILTSNKTKKGLKGIHADNIIDRFAELIDITLQGESFRKRDSALSDLLKDEGAA